MNNYHKISKGIFGEETIVKTNVKMFLEFVKQHFP